MEKTVGSAMPEPSKYDMLDVVRLTVATDLCCVVARVLAFVSCCLWWGYWMECCLGVPSRIALEGV